MKKSLDEFHWQWEVSKRDVMQSDLHKIKVSLCLLRYIDWTTENRARCLVRNKEATRAAWPEMMGLVLGSGKGQGESSCRIRDTFSVRS